MKFRNALKKRLSLDVLGLFLQILVVGVIATPAAVFAAPTADQIERLELQHRLDYDAPLYNATFIGTHNSYSSSAYGYKTLLNQDETITRQLEAGARALSLDLHGFFGDIYVCHVDCLLRPNRYLFKSALSEIDAWLSRAENKDEVIVIVFQNTLDTDGLHSTAVDEIDAEIGNRVYRPKDYAPARQHDGETNKCRELPMQDLSKRAVRDAGGAKGRNILLIIDDCKRIDHEWRDWVWHSTFSVPSLDDLRDDPFGGRRAQERWFVAPEDRCIDCITYDPVSGPEFAEFLDLGAAILGLDYFIRDNRHEALIWSWIPNQPDDSGDCATQTDSSRWAVESCLDEYQFACQTTSDEGFLVAGDNLSVRSHWKITSGQGPFEQGQIQCEAEFGPDYLFSLPVNAQANFDLHNQRTLAGFSEVTDPVWLNHRRINDVWTVVDFVDVQVLPEQLTFFPFRLFEHYKIPEDTPYDRVEFRVKGGDGGDARVRFQSSGRQFFSEGGKGASLIASFAIGEGEMITPGSTIGIVVADPGQDSFKTRTTSLDPKYATGGGGGGSAVLVYRPFDSSEVQTESPWVPLVVAGGGGGAFRRNQDSADNGGPGVADPLLTAETEGRGGDNGAKNCSGGGGGAYGPGLRASGNLENSVFDDSGGWGGRDGGTTGRRLPVESSTPNYRFGGGGYGAGGRSGNGSVSGAGGGGGYEGGDGGDCGTSGASRRGGQGGRSFVHPGTEDGSIALGSFLLPAGGQSSDRTDGVIVVTFSISNVAPLAEDDGYDATEDAVLNIGDPGVLGNDSDDDGGALTAVLDTSTSNGSLTLNADGSFSYTPDPDYCGADGFTYHADDGAADSNSATVDLTIACVNDAPSFTANDPPAVDEDSGAQTASVASGFDPGPANESGQTVDGYIVSDVVGGALLSAGPTVDASGVLSYTPAAEAFGTVTFNLKVKDDGGTANGGVDTSGAQAVSITIDPVNDAPMASDNSYSVNEDSQLAGNVILDDTSSGVDSDTEGDGFSVSSNTDVSHGSLALSPDGSFTYDPNENYCGPDGFTYQVTEDSPATPPALSSNTATVSITVDCVNDPPEVTSVSPDSQTSDYSDFIGSVTITVVDVDDTSTTLAASNEPPISAGGLLLSSDGCLVNVTESPDEDGSSCSWSYGGQVLDPGDNVYEVLFTPSDDDGAGSVTGEHGLTIELEDATVLLDLDNPASVEVAVEGGDSGMFSLYYMAWETTYPEDFPHGGSAAPGDLGEMVPFMTLNPVGPGSPETVACNFLEPLPDELEGYDQVGLFECVFDQIAVNTYQVEAFVSGEDGTSVYYSGMDDAVLVVFDPSLGFTTGGGWFYWPGSEDPSMTACGPDGYAGDRTNFGYNMKYNKKQTNVQGSLLVMRHVVDADCEDADKYRAKSNAIHGLSIGSGTDFDGPYGWAAFSGKSVFSEPGFEGAGNHPFLVYVEDHQDEGGNQEPPDEFWILVQDQNGIVVLEVGGPDSDPSGPDEATDGDDAPIHNGNIVVPH